jgi:acyl-CoA synthetase (NDP forming)
VPARRCWNDPVDMLASATAEHYARALGIILEDEQVDSVITIFIPPLVTDPNNVAEAIAESTRDVHGKRHRIDGVRCRRADSDWRSTPASRRPARRILTASSDPRGR